MRMRERRSHVPGVVFALVEGVVVAETESAFAVESDDYGTVWFPFSQVEGTYEKGDTIDGVWVKRWLAEQKDLEYEE